VYMTQWVRYAWTSTRFELALDVRKQVDKEVFPEGSIRLVLWILLFHWPTPPTHLLAYKRYLTRIPTNPLDNDLIQHDSSIPKLHKKSWYAQ